MKKALWVAILAVIGLFTGGCATWGPAIDDAVSKIDGERLGRFVTIAYMSQKDKMKPEYRQVVETVYKQFNDLVESPDVSDVAKDKLIEVVKNSLKDKPELAMIGAEIIDMYWAELQAKYDIDSMIGEKRLAVLRDFNKGIKGALEDYKMFKEGDKATAKPKA